VTEEQDPVDCRTER